MHVEAVELRRVDALAIVSAIVVMRVSARDDALELRELATIDRAELNQLHHRIADRGLGTRILVEDDDL